MATSPVTDSNFDQEVLNAAGPVAVYFWAQWCVPCRAVAPVLEEISGEMDGQIKVVKVNLDENHGIASKYGIRSVPTILVFKGGDIVGQRVGGTTKGEMSKLFQSAL